MSEAENNPERKNRPVRSRYNGSLSHTDLRRRAEEALEESAEKFKLFSEQLLMGVIVLQDGIVKYCNPAMTDIIGYSAEEMLEWGPEEFGKVIHPEFLEFALEQARKKQLGEKDVVPHYTYKLIAKSGRNIWVDQFSKTIRYEGRPADLVTMVDVTLQKEAEKALFEREQQYRDLIETMNDGFAILDEDGIITYANEKMCDMLGYSRRELMGKKATEFLNARNAKLLYENSTDGRLELKQAIDITWNKNNGLPLHSIVSVSPIYNTDGNYAGSNAVITDITGRKAAEEAIRKSEARYRELFDNAMEGIVVLDEDEIIVFSNEAFANIIGADSARKAVGRCILDFLPEDQKDILLSQSEQRRRKRSSRYELNIITTLGEPKTILVSVSPRLDKNGEFVGSFGTVLDITERKRAETDLRKTRDELDQRVKERTLELAEANRQLKKSIFDLYNIFELSRNFNAVLDYSSLLDSFMLATMGRMGSTKSALYIRREIDKNEFDLARSKGEELDLKPEIVIDSSGPFYRHLTAINRPVQVREVKEKFVKRENLGFIRQFPNGLVIPLVFQTRLRGVLIISGRSASRTYQGSDLEFLAILANQTAVSIENARLYESEKAAQVELQKTQQLLARSEKSAALGELSAKVAHEINNPLGIINNYLVLVGRALKKGDKSIEHLRVVRGEMDRIAKIVRQLLDFHRPILAKYIDSNPRKILKETLALMKYQFEEADISIAVKADSDVPHIKAWPEGLKQVFMNLLANARDAVGEGGKIFISITGTDDKVTFLFEDNGPGIPEDKLPHVFESFFTTKTETGGTGLGLSVCKRIINNHNGSITFCNTERGGCFKIELPIEQKDKEYDWRI